MNPTPISPANGPERPPAWEILEQAITQRRPIRAHYHGKPRLLCPHALGWKNGRAKALVYQADGTTSTGTLPANPHQRWRSLYVDEIEDATITNDEWQTADNYTPNSNGIDNLILAIT